MTFLTSLATFSRGQSGSEPMIVLIEPKLVNYILTAPHGLTRLYSENCAALYRL